jgi:bifunctional non-homologous end joining protein LigD
MPVASVEAHDSSAVLRQLADPREAVTIAVGRQELALSNLDKPLWPKAKPQPVTKRDLLTYLASVSRWMLPHLEGRPAFPYRMPHGIGGEGFYQRSWEAPPAFVHTVPTWSTEHAGPRPHLVVANLTTLLWLAQQGAVELHAGFARTTRSFDGWGLGIHYGESEEDLARSRLNYPDFLVVDLDSYLYSGRENPGEEPELHRRGFELVREVALEVREVVATLGLEAYVKTSGRTGLHLYLPILRKLNFEEVRGAARALGEFLHRRHPDRITLQWAVRERTGMVFFDYNQNARAKSLAAAYSPRRHPDATVSMPLRWEELHKIYPTQFTIRTVPALLARQGDPWAEMLSSKVDLAAAVGPSARAS